MGYASSCPCNPMRLVMSCEYNRKTLAVPLCCCTYRRRTTRKPRMKGISVSPAFNLTSVAVCLSGVPRCSCDRYSVACHRTMMFRRADLSRVTKVGSIHREVWQLPCIPRDTKSGFSSSWCSTGEYGPIVMFSTHPHRPK